MSRKAVSASAVRGRRSGCSIPSAANTRYGATRQIQSKEKQDSARWAVAEREGSNACTGKSTSWFRGRFAVGIRYKVHGEWRFFRWLCKEDQCMRKKANGVSDLEGDGERKEFCRETG